MKKHHAVLVREMSLQQLSDVLNTYFGMEASAGDIQCAGLLIRTAEIDDAVVDAVEFDQFIVIPFDSFRSTVEVWYSDPLLWVFSCELACAIARTIARTKSTETIVVIDDWSEASHWYDTGGNDINSRTVDRSEGRE